MARFTIQARTTNGFRSGEDLEIGENEFDSREEAERALSALQRGGYNLRDAEVVDSSWPADGPAGERINACT